jgi:hypothetical protein
MAIETTSDLSLVGTSQIVDGSVTSAKIGTGAVVSAGISAGAVGSAALASGAVVSAAIAAGAVGSSALATGSVVAAAISAGAVGTAAISSGAATSGQILQANGSGAVAFATPAAGGGFTLIATATLSSATGVQFSSIPSGYKHLLVRWDGMWASSATGVLQVRLNNNSGSNYQYRRVVIASGVLAQSAGTNNATEFGGTSGDEGVVQAMPTSATNYYSLCQGSLIIYDYTSTSKIFPIETTCSTRYSTVPAKNWYEGYYSVSGTAITQIDFIRSSTQTINGNFYLYGVS